ncbi:MAG: amino acid adenylation domain-containing protein, partial [Pseudomonadota bacterium]
MNTCNNTLKTENYWHQELSGSEEQQLPTEFNQTSTEYPSDKTIVSLFEEQVEKTPEAIAVVFEGQQLTYQTLNQQANQLAHYLHTLKVGPETIVGIHMERSPKMIIGLLGILKAGGAYLPLDMAYPVARLMSVLEDAMVSIVLTQSSLIDRFSESTAQVFCLDAETELLSQFSVENPLTEVGPKNLAYVIYTSGSTGKPKGVMVEHQGLVNYIWWAKKHYLQNELLDFPLFSSVSFDLTVTSLYVPLISGSKIVIYREESNNLPILQVIEDNLVDIIKLTPSHLSLIKEMNLSNSKLKKFIVGGEDLKTSLAKTISDAFGGNVEIYNEFGPTETVVGCMCYRFNPDEDVDSSVSIGKPADNVQIYLLDETLNPVPIGIAGEIYVSGDGVARGYLNRQDLTAERFIPNPFSLGKTMYRTGDRAIWQSADNMQLLGRTDNQVKIRGYRIELGEIEAEFLAHEDVRECVVSVSGNTANEIKYCTKCGLPSNAPGITFDTDGVCNVCFNFDVSKEKYLKYFQTMKDLQTIFDESKPFKKSEYDCLLLFSGGKDSTYVLYQLVNMGLKVLAYTFDNGYISESAKTNIQRVVNELKVDHILGSTPYMDAFFVDSLKQYSNVCNSCFKSVYTFSMNLAHEKGIKYIVTGLSRGQIFDARLAELFKNNCFDLDQIDQTVLEARKVYHRMDDLISKSLDVNLFKDDAFFDDVQFIDFYRYSDVTREEILRFLKENVHWIMPTETGMCSTNCSINDVGIYIHTKERGFHNYALANSWEVRLGHLTREAALEELKNTFDMNSVKRILNKLEYEEKQKQTGIDAQANDKWLTAYIVPNLDDSTSELDDLVQELQTDTVSQWKNVYKETYNPLRQTQDLMFDISGWNSSYTGSAIPANEMREWVNTTVAAILSLQPKRVLEIGCGTGLLLSRIAPHCHQYLGTDLSADVLQQLEQLKQANNLKQVTLFNREAKDFNKNIEPESFDTIIINSVIQCFPNITYLVDVLDKAIKTIKPGGYIFIGDVRSLPLLKAYHTSVQLYQASDSLSRLELQQRVQQRLAQEEELVIDPHFFIALKQHFPRLQNVHIHVKQGHYHNELTRFRYDVILEVNDTVLPSLEIAWQDWQSSHFTLSTLRQHLIENRPEVFGLQAVPNARLNTETQTLEWLATNTAPEKTVEQWRKTLTKSQSARIEPEELWHLAQDLSYDVVISWANASSDGSYDVVFRDQKTKKSTDEYHYMDLGKKIVHSKPWSHYANNPLQSKLNHKLVPQLRQFLQDKLPEYMMPLAFVMLDTIPLTPNGKVDFRALPSQDTAFRALSENYVAPRTPAEETMAGIWAEIFGLETIGIHDDFFKL